MLVLSRTIGQSLLIGPNIRLTVCAISGGQVRIGIEAPQEVKVLREEVARREASRAKGHEGGLGNGSQGESARSGSQFCRDQVPQSGAR